MKNTVNKIELLVKKQGFLGRLNKVELVFKDPLHRKEYPINLTKQELMLIPGMIQTMSSYRHNEFYIEKDGEHEREIILRIVHKKSAFIGYEHLVAYVTQSSFLELLDGLAWELN